MLMSIREKAQGWIAWVIVILISIPFALFGIQEYLGADSDPVVAEVAGVDIKRSQLDEQLRELRQNMRDRLGSAYRAEMFEGPLVERQTLGRMLTQAVVEEAAADWNLRASDQQVVNYIHQIPGLQTDGRFDQALYESAVRSRGMSSAGFEELVRQEIVLQQFQAGVMDSAWETQSTLRERVRLNEQKRDVDVVVFKAADFKDPAKLSQQQIADFYEKNKSNYVVPERVKLSYVRLSPDVLTGTVTVSDDELRDFYEQNRDQFVAPEERKMRHILLTATPENEAQQLAAAEKLVSELNAGGDFAALAKKHSEDPGSADLGGDLGWVSRGVMVPEFEDAGFALNKNVISEPVKSQFGYHVIQVTDIRGGNADFNSQKEKVAKAYRQRQADDLFYNQYERLADLAYETPDSLLPAAEALGLKVKQTEWVSREGKLPAEINQAKVLNAAFSEDVLQRGNNSEVIELGPTDAVVVRVAKHEPESIQPLDAVAEKVKAQAASEMASQLAKEAGEAFVNDAQNDIAGKAKAANKTLKSLSLTRRDANLPVEVVDAAFAMTRSITNVVSAEGDFYVIALKKATDGNVDAMKADELKVLAEALERQASDAQFTALTDALRDRSGAKITLAK